MCIKKAIFPVAGFGTRFLPATKASPKEMLPIIDKPIIQYAVEEAIAAGIKELIFVTSDSKRAIEDHFDSNFELEYMLQERGKTELLQQIQNIVPDDVHCVYIRQKRALGLGHAVLCAAQLIDDEYFAVILADDLIESSHQNCLQQMISAHNKTQASILAVQKINRENSHQYGIVAPVDKENLQPLQAIKAVVEKPQASQAPSDLAIVGRYILSHQIFDFLKKTDPGAGTEIQLTDAIQKLIEVSPLYALQFEGKRYDCGSKLGYLEATLAYGLKHPELAGPFRELLNGYTHEK